MQRKTMQQKSMHQTSQLPAAVGGPCENRDQNSDLVFERTFDALDTQLIVIRCGSVLYIGQQALRSGETRDSSFLCHEDVLSVVLLSFG